MKFLDYYRVFDFMRREFGFTKKLGAYMLIYSFYEYNEKVKAEAPDGTEPDIRPCIISFDEFAEYLMCARSNAQNAIKYLIEHGYITATKISTWGKPNSTEYAINAERLDEMLKKQPTQNRAVNIPKTGKSTYSKQVSQHTQNRAVNIPETGTFSITEDSTEMITERGTETPAHEITEESKPVSAEHVTMYGIRKNVPLTDSDLETLKGYRLGKDKHGNPRTLESYLDSISAQIANGKRYKDIVATLVSWITVDGGHKATTSEGVTAADLEALANPCFDWTAEDEEFYSALIRDGNKTPAEIYRKATAEERAKHRKDPWFSEII